MIIIINILYIVMTTVMMQSNIHEEVVIDSFSWEHEK